MSPLGKSLDSSIGRDWGKVEIVAESVIVGVSSPAETAGLAMSTMLVAPLDDIFFALPYKTLPFPMTKRHAGAFPSSDSWYTPEDECRTEASGGYPRVIPPLRPLVSPPTWTTRRTAGGRCSWPGLSHATCLRSSFSSPAHPSSSGWCVRSSPKIVRRTDLANTVGNCLYTILVTCAIALV